MLAKTIKAILCTFLLAMGLGTVTTPASVSASEAETPAPEETDQPTGKLVKEDGHYHYYQDGKLVTSKWVTIDGKQYYFKKNGNAAVLSSKIEGKKGKKDKYYVFNNKGQLLSPSSKKVITVDTGKGKKKYYVNPNGTAASGWANNKTYYFYETGEAATGIIVLKEKFYSFNPNGKYMKAKTKKIRKAAKYEKPFAKLKKLIGAPKKSKYRSSCYGKGKDGELTYDNFTVYTFRPDKGKEIFMGAE